MKVPLEEASESVKNAPISSNSESDVTLELKILGATYTKKKTKQKKLG